jgi:hypothetical protein
VPAHADQAGQLEKVASFVSWDVCGVMAWRGRTELVTSVDEDGTRPAFRAVVCRGRRHGVSRGELIGRGGVHRVWEGGDGIGDVEELEGACRSTCWARHSQLLVSPIW